VQFAQIVPDQLAGSGIPPSTYVDSGELSPPSDIAGLNLAKLPSVLRARQHDERGGLGPDEDAGASLEVAGAVVAVSRASSELRPAGFRILHLRCGGRLTALDLLLEVLQHLALNLRNPNGANVFSKNPPMPPAPCYDVLTVTDEPGPAVATVQLVSKSFWARAS
jgi:hypothetical protein